MSGYSIVGYDPGGNMSHGLAICKIADNKAVNINSYTMESVEAVLQKIFEVPNLSAIGVDTFTNWSSAKSGWRPADLWLKERYPKVRPSVASPNSLYGSMSISGMAVLIELSQKFSGLIISETHPKVIYYALSAKKHDYNHSQAMMDRFLSELFGLNVDSRNEHEWDAAMAAYSVWQGIQGNWSSNLHTLPCPDKSRIIEPCGKTVFYWPDKNDGI